MQGFTECRKPIVQETLARLEVKVDTPKTSWGGADEEGLRLPFHACLIFCLVDERLALPPPECCRTYYRLDCSL